MADKHSLCKHKRSCVANSALGYVRGGIIGLSIRAIITLLVGIFRKTLFKNPLGLVLKIFHKENMRLVFFLSGTIGVYRSVLCLLRRITNNEKISSFFAGFASGIPLLFEEPESRVLYSLYVFVRSMDTVFKFLVAKKIFPKVTNFMEFMFVVSISIMHYTRVWNSDCLNRGYLNMLNRFTREPNDPIYTDMIGYGDKFNRKK